MDEYTAVCQSGRKLPKTPASTYGVEKAVRQMRTILADDRAQENCTWIMGEMPPYLSYVHKHLPALPLAHCTWIREETPYRRSG